MKIFARILVAVWLCIAFVGCDNKRAKMKQINAVVTETTNLSQTTVKTEKVEEIHGAMKKEVALAKSVKEFNDKKSREYRINYNYRDKTVKLEDYFTNIHYVPLETNEAALLTNDPTRVVYNNQQIYISDYSPIHSVYLFNSGGKFIRTIGQPGEGPKNYVNFLSMNVSPKGWVSMTDRCCMSVITYTVEGEFVSRIKLDSIPLGNPVFLNDSLFLIKNTHNWNGYKYHVLDIRNGRVTNVFHPMQKRMYQMYFPEGFTIYKDKVLMSEYQSNEIIELTSQGANVRYILNINDKMPPKGFWEQEVKNYSLIEDEEKNKNYIGHIPCFAESDHFILFRFRGNLYRIETKGMTVVNKETGKYETFNHIALTEKFKIKPDFFHPQKDGQVIFLLTAEDILNSGDNDFIARFPELVEDSNPVLLFATLK